MTLISMYDWMRSDLILFLNDFSGTFLMCSSRLFHIVGPVNCKERPSITEELAQEIPPRALQ